MPSTPLTVAQQRAINELQDLIHDDPESAHLAADEILLTLIDNEAVPSKSGMPNHGEGMVKSAKRYSDPEVDRAVDLLNEATQILSARLPDEIKHATRPLPTNVRRSGDLAVLMHTSFAIKHNVERAASDKPWQWRAS